LVVEQSTAVVAAADAPGAAATRAIPTGKTPAAVTTPSPRKVLRGCTNVIVLLFVVESLVIRDQLGDDGRQTDYTSTHKVIATESREWPIANDFQYPHR
jgi:hypothetical protein